MYFKPKVFISSVLSLTSIRDQLENHFTNTGAEVLLYERNLTPSVIKETYKQDILDSDFVIMILDEKYGTKTGSGISGTHEEYEIIKKTSIPMHIYIKKGCSDSDMKAFQKEISNDKVSYYLYEDEINLVKRIIQTTFQIGKEISLNDFDNLRITDNKVKKLMINKDYELGINLLRDINDILDAIKYYQIGDIDSDIWEEYFEVKCSMYFDYKHWFFIDSKLDDLYRNILISYQNYSSYATTIYVYGKQSYKTKLRSNVEIEFHKFQLNNSFNDVTKLQKLFDAFIKSVKKLQATIFDLKHQIDINT